MAEEASLQNTQDAPVALGAPSQRREKLLSFKDSLWRAELSDNVCFLPYNFMYHTRFHKDILLIYSGDKNNKNKNKFAKILFKHLGTLK